jgi:excinuclease ABC subunit C
MQEQLTEEMRKAALAQDYEKAAMYRDAINDLKQTTKRTNKFERLPYTLPVAIEPQRDLAELGRVLNLPGPPMRIEGFDISNISGTFAVASMVSFKNGRPDRSNYRKFKMKTVVGQNDFACMAETVRRRYSRLLKENAPAKIAESLAISQAAAGELPIVTEPHKKDKERIPPQLNPVPRNMPDLILVDGGKGQLSSACEELAKLGLSGIPIIGLAKEFEEIFRPGESEPLRLSHDTGALKLLQRVRDESHRFANTYNAALRLRKISESILDEFPSIGERRKSALLKRFGSVQRLRLATVEQIAEVPGFGGKAAGELKAFLDARTVMGEKKLATD